jgi:hypothetical protein
MYKLFTDKTEIFECSISLEGANISNSNARLVVESTDLNLLFKGEVDSSTGKCTIPIKKLKGILAENTEGVMRLEVIADDTYFSPWQSNFQVDTSKKITVDVVPNNVVNNTPKLTVESIKSSSPENKIVEKQKPKKEDNISYIDKHAFKLIELLSNQDITLYNINENKAKLNNTINTYLKKNIIPETEKQNLIWKILENML